MSICGKTDVPIVYSIWILHKYKLFKNNLDIFVLPSRHSPCVYILNVSSVRSKLKLIHWEYLEWNHNYTIFFVHLDTVSRKVLIIEKNRSNKRRRFVWSFLCRCHLTKKALKNINCHISNKTFRALTRNWINSEKQFKKKLPRA